jgi:poly(A) polymerase
VQEIGTKATAFHRLSPAATLRTSRLSCPAKRQTKHMILVTGVNPGWQRPPVPVRAPTVPRLSIALSPGGDNCGIKGTDRRKRGTRISGGPLPASLAMLPGMGNLTAEQQRAIDRLVDAAPFAPIARDLGARFAEAGHELYLVGGSVRDALLNRPSSDVDFTTGADPEAIQRILRDWKPDALWLQGVRFGTVGARKDGIAVEITTYRSDIYRSDSRKPEVTFGTSITDDLARRDFSINAMAVRLPDGQFVDPFGGLGDLAERRLRTPIDPATSFEDDPLRMLRAARFVAQLDAHLDPVTEAAIVERAERLDIVSRERVRDELSKLLVAPKPAPGVWVVIATGLAERFLPELPALALEQDPIHRHKDVLRHSVAVLERATTFDADDPDLVLRLAALLHDVGKPRTRRFGPDGVSFHMHETVGARMVEKRLHELRFPNQVVTEVRELVRLHMRFHGYAGDWTDSAVRRYVHDAGPLLERLNALVRSDCTTRNPARARRLSARMDDLEVRIERLAEAEEQAKLAKPAIDGHEVMRLLGVPPGPIVGRALAHLSELRLDQGPMDPDETRAELQRWAKVNGLPTGCPPG